jgi:hypothetical protein
VARTCARIEKLISGHHRGDLPTDPSDPNLRPRWLRFEVLPETDALLRQARGALASEANAHVDDDRFLAVLARGFLAGSATEARPTHQIAVTVCEQCQRGWQDGGGEAIEIGPEAIERARCDAHDIGSLEATRPARATRTIPPAKRRLVFRRDHGRCRVDGCRSTRFLEIHHLVLRADGGQHDVDQMILLCDGCHAAVHRGTLRIHGTSQAHLTFTRIEHGTAAPVTAPTLPSKLGIATLRVQVRDPLVGLGFTRSEASGACDAAIPHVENPTLDTLMREALRRSRKPRGCVERPHAA